jgi:hypothetical protein
MATNAQIAANQRNARKSTGPSTPAAKARTRRNATRHGLCSGVALQSDEDPEEFETLHADLRAEHQPDGPTEDILVYKMAESFWFSWRASILLAERLDFNDGEDDSKQVSLMLRYHTTADRSFLRHLNELRKLQKERRLEEIGIVSQNPESHSDETSDETLAVAPGAPAATPAAVAPSAEPRQPVIRTLHFDPIPPRKAA